MPDLLNTLLSSGDEADYAVALDYCEQFGVVLDATPMVYTVPQSTRSSLDGVGRFPVHASIYGRQRPGGSQLRYGPWEYRSTMLPSLDVFGMAIFEARHVVTRGPWGYWSSEMYPRFSSARMTRVRYFRGTGT